MENITRRSFVKRTSLSGAAVYILAQGSALGADTSGCPGETTKSNYGSYVESRTDVYRCYIKIQGGNTFWVLTTGTPVFVSGTKSPGTFLPTTEFQKDGKTCKYVIKAAAPVPMPPSETPWSKVSGTIPAGGAGSIGTSLPDKPELWSSTSMANEVKYTHTVSWSAVQAYILQ